MKGNTIYRKVHAVVKMSLTRTVDLIIDENAPQEEIENRALDEFRREWYSYDEAEVIKIVWADGPPMFSND